MAGALLLALAGAAQAGDGAALFETHCAACHAREAGAPPGPGPNLAGVMGRRIGGAPGFGYSPALREAGGAWDRARLVAFLADPDEAFPGAWMSMTGLSGAGPIEAVVRFLEQP